MSLCSEMIQCFTNMESIILFLYEMWGRYDNLCTLETPYATDLCSYQCESKCIILGHILKNLQRLLDYYF